MWFILLSFIGGAIGNCFDHPYIGTMIGMLIGAMIHFPVIIGESLEGLTEIVSFLD